MEGVRLVRGNHVDLIVTVGGGSVIDCAHGAGLAALSVSYYEYIYPYGIDKFVRFANRIWGVDTCFLTS